MTSGMVEARIRNIECLCTKHQCQDIDLRNLKNSSTALHPYFTQEEYSLDMAEELFTDSLGQFLSLKDTLSHAENPSPEPIQHKPLPPLAVAAPQSSTTLPKVPLQTFGRRKCQTS